jgi:hypothetical protein
MALYKNTGTLENPVWSEYEEEGEAVSLSETDDQGIFLRTMKNFNYSKVTRIHFSNIIGPPLKNTKVVWIMRGRRQSDGGLFTWRNKDVPSTSNAGQLIIEGTEKVLGYFYEE